MQLSDELCNLSDGVKNLFLVKRAGEDVEKVLQRHLFTSTPYNEKH
jgi:hypothetical protein